MTTMMLPTTTPASHNNHPDNDLLHDERDWCGALNTLAKFAAFDTMEYASLLVARNNTNKSQGQQRRSDKATKRPKEHCELMLQLEALRKDRSLGETPIPDLVQAIHRFHSNLALWHHQDAQHAQEMRNLQAALAASQDRELLLAQECKTLRKQTTKLRTKLKEKRHVMAQVRTWCRASMAERESLQEIATAAQLQVHEHVMLSSPGRIRLGSTETTDSNFSDVDALNFMVESCDYSTANNTDGTDADLTQTETNEGSESQSSLVTDEGVATLHFTPDESLPRIAATSSTYTLEFASGIKTGMRVKAVPLAEWVPSSKPALSPVHLEGTQVNGQAVALLDEQDELDDTTTEGLAFVVCGHHKFGSDDDTNEKTSARAALPPIGARILGVRNQRIPPAWDLSEVLGAMASTEDGKPTFSVTFRNGRTIKPKQSKALAGLDDDSSSQEEGKTSETTQQEKRPFSLLHFGKHASAKGKDEDRQDPVEPKENKPAPQRGNGNPLMFWRNEDKTNASNQKQLDELSLGESATRDPSMEETLQSNDETESKLDQSKSDNKTKDQIVPLSETLSETLSESHEMEERLRKNTAESFANTEATALSKEDASVASCSDSKAEEDKTSEETEVADATATQNKPTPMNHFMFWRKSEALPAGDVETGEDVAQPESGKKESETLYVENAATSEKPGFRMPFWNAQARQNQASSGNEANEASGSAEEKHSLASGSVEGNNASAQTNPQEDDMKGERSSVQSTEQSDQAGTTAIDATTGGDKEPDSEIAQNSSVDGEGATVDNKEVAEGPKEDVTTSSAQLADEAPTDTGSELVDTEISTKQATEKTEGQAPTTEQDGPMKQMGRFFSNPFAK